MTIESTTRMPDAHHHVEVEFEPGYNPSVRFTCTAPEGASCRMMPACYLGPCMEYGEDGGHREECTEAERRLVDQGECNIALWIDNGAAGELGDGKVSFPVATEWTGDDFNFIPTMPSTSSVLGEVLTERKRQLTKHGDQAHLLDGTGPGLLWPTNRAEPLMDRQLAAKWATGRTDNAASIGMVTFEHILTEEYAEAIAESDPAKLRAELVQVAAVAVQWIEAIDRREDS